MGEPELVLAGQALSIAEVVAVARASRPLWLSAEAGERLARARRQIVAIVAGEQAVYGINTGFGSLSSVRIAPGSVAELQLNLVRSHAAGAGEPLPDETVRALMLLCAASLARGHSGVRPQVVTTLCALLNAGIHPLVPSRGSVGASGDLAPLAHVALALIGEGRVRAQGREQPAAEALAEAGIAPLQLEAKEGLALLNGTHLMAGSASLLVHDAEQLLESAICAAAMSLEGALGSITPLDARIHALRPHAGQQAVAARMRALIEGSAIPSSHRDCPRVQDPYSLRCAPQILGAVADAIAYVRAVVALELGAVTDNPLCFPEDEAVLSGGNFHGQPLALALDMLAIALTHLAGVSERRSYLLLSAHEPAMRLPPFLSPEPGLRSGLMVAQYTAAALLNECQSLAHPASLASVPTSAGMEDFNSMGATSALKARQILAQARRIVAVELLCAAQAIEFHRPLRSGAGVERAHALIRARVAPLDQDRPLSEDIAAIEGLIAAGALALA